MARKRSGKFYSRNEREVMERFGLKPTPGSGSQWLFKEDGQNEHVICQLKSTDAQSIRLKKEDIETLEHNATICHKIPVFMIQFLQTDDVFIIARPTDLPELVKYIETGEYEAPESIILEEVEQSEIKVIKSGSRDKFWKQKQKEWEEKCQKR